MADRWYMALLVFRSSVKTELADEALNDVQYRLVRAVDPEAAYAKAMALGGSENGRYQNAEGQEVAWQFLGLRDLREILESDLTDGAEVYSELERGDRSLVLPKERLSVFWVEANKHRTAQEILEGR